MSGHGRPLHRPKILELQWLDTVRDVGVFDGFQSSCACGWGTTVSTRADAEDAITRHLQSSAWDWLRRAGDIVGGAVAFVLAAAIFWIPLALLTLFVVLAIVTKIVGWH